MKTSGVVRSAALSLALIVAGSCSSASDVGKPVALSTGGVGATAQDANDAYLEMIRCMEAGGLTGSVRFDLAFGRGVFYNVSLGKDLDAGQAIYDDCRAPFEVVLESHIASHPETEPQIEARRQRLTACIQDFFPNAEISVQDVYELHGFLNSLAFGEEGSAEAQACADASEAGPERTFGVDVPS